MNWERRDDTLPFCPLAARPTVELSGLRAVDVQGMGRSLQRGHFCALWDVQQHPWPPAAFRLDNHNPPITIIKNVSRHCQISTEVWGMRNPHPTPPPRLRTGQGREKEGQSRRACGCSGLPRDCAPQCSHWTAFSQHSLGMGREGLFIFASPPRS